MMQILLNQLPRFSLAGFMFVGFLLICEGHKAFGVAEIIPYFDAEELKSLKYNLKFKRSNEVVLLVAKNMAVLVRITGSESPSDGDREIQSISYLYGQAEIEEMKNIFTETQKRIFRVGIELPMSGFYTAGVETLTVKTRDQMVRQILKKIIPKLG